MDLFALLKEVEGHLLNAKSNDDSKSFSIDSTRCGHSSRSSSTGENSDKNIAGEKRKRNSSLRKNTNGIAEDKVALKALDEKNSPCLPKRQKMNSSCIHEGKGGKCHLYGCGHGCDSVCSRKSSKIAAAHTPTGLDPLISEKPSACARPRLHRRCRDKRMLTNRNDKFTMNEITSKIKLSEKPTKTELQDIGFEWTVPARISFEERVLDLEDFKNEFGHCDVSQSTPGYKSLGVWCAKTRYANRQFQLKAKRKTKRLSKDNIKRLNDIGFTWTNAAYRSFERPATVSRAFEERLLELEDF